MGSLGAGIKEIFRLIIIMALLEVLILLCTAGLCYVPKYTEELIVPYIIEILVQLNQLQKTAIEYLKPIFFP